MGKYIKIYGERNTNTNYMSQLIAMNLDIMEIRGIVPKSISKLQSILPGEEAIKDLYFLLLYGKTLGWKHTCVKRWDKLSKYKLVNLDLVIFLTITKNPYSWLLSLYRRPYHQYTGDGLNFEEFIRRPWKLVARDNAGKILPNPVELWNVKNRSYLNLKKELTINTTTEEILRDPEKIIYEISNQFNIKRKYPFTNSRHRAGTRSFGREF